MGAGVRTGWGAERIGREEEIMLAGMPGMPGAVSDWAVLLDLPWPDEAK